MPPKRPDPRANASSAGKDADAPRREENIYIPSFISKRPFYAVDLDDPSAAAPDSSAPDYLEHQRLRKPAQEDNKWYDRGRAAAGPAATRFRKGACDNCGAMTHAPKDCLERPRAKGARWSGADIKPDERIQDIKLGWDAKRDRWNGYDARDYRAVVDEYAQMDALRKDALAMQRKDGGGAGGGEDGEGENDVDGDRYADENDMSKHQSTATRQLRLREDTAKYLLNLDLGSAKYDPKTRTLVDAGVAAEDGTTSGKDLAAEVFAEEGFLRAAGDAEEFDRVQRYAWEAQERRGDTAHHVQANPTAGAVARKQELGAAERKRNERDALLRAQYGDGDGNDGDAAAASKQQQQQQQLAAARTKRLPPPPTAGEVFVEYDAAGLVVGAPRTVLRSRYAEDVLVNNHTAVWGSWWHDFAWGYACCRSTTRQSYCVGEVGLRAWEEERLRRQGLGGVFEDGKEDDEEAAKEDEQPRAKKRPREEGAVTEADMDEYRRKRTVADDPMAAILGRDELVS